MLKVRFSLYSAPVIPETDVSRLCLFHSLSLAECEFHSLNLAECEFHSPSLADREFHSLNLVQGEFSGPTRRCRCFSSGNSIRYDLSLSAGRTRKQTLNTLDSTATPLKKTAT